MSMWTALGISGMGKSDSALLCSTLCSSFCPAQRAETHEKQFVHVWSKQNIPTKKAHKRRTEAPTQAPFNFQLATQKHTKTKKGGSRMKLLSSW
mmetsp:Transcript_70135/g.152986  ORF Transcript_70135/g.152986 Transcript_70135/m.152986 type:complete len:94 (+) Transcript_70135:229-510(+)